MRYHTLLSGLLACSLVLSAGAHPACAAEEDVDVARAQLNQGFQEFAAKNYAGAAEQLTPAYDTLRRTLGDTHPDTVDALHMLARTLAASGDSAVAERLYKQLVPIYVQTLGENDERTATALLDLAVLYGGWNDYGSAETCLSRALAIDRHVLGDTHPDTVGLMVMLSVVEARLGKFDAAETQCRQAIEITRQAFGPDDSRVGAATGSLGTIYFLAGKYDQAQQCFEAFLAGRPANTAAERYENAIVQEKLASIALGSFHYDQAAARAAQVIDVYKQSLPDSHPAWSDVLLTAGIAQLHLRDFDQAKRLSERALRVTQHELDAAASAQSERQQLALNYRLRQTLDLYLSLPDDVVVPADAYGHILFWKGAIQARRARDRRDASDPRTAELRDLTAHVAAISLAPPAPEHREAWLRQLDQLKQRKESLEAELAPGSQGDRTITLQQLQASLPPRTALIDVFAYVGFGKGPGGEIPDENRFVAFVVRHDHPIERIQLGSAQQIKDAVDRWRRESLFRSGSFNSDAALALRQLIWAPLHAHLEGCKTILFSPDSVLSSVPLGALPGDEPGTYLLEQRTISVVPVPQLLPDLLAASAATAKSASDDAPSLLILGGIDYDAPVDDGDSSPQTARDPSGQLITFAPLRAAPAEIERVKAQFRERFPSGKLLALTKAKATEAAFCSAAPEYRWLLIATHGFYAPTNLSAALDVQDQLHGFDAEHRAARGGVLSGLALAGANRQTATTSVADAGSAPDGILTAAEVATLDLRRVELAVLSGCETGLGDDAFGQGTIGLERAFQLAGARATIASLWSVPDKRTSQLIGRFYFNLWDRKLSNAQALRQAQLWLMRGGADEQGRGTEPGGGPTRLAPYHWAAFTLSGDWR